MNRELKFRAWNKQTKKMIDIHATTQLALDIDTLIAKGAGMGVYIPDHPDLIIEQYTGLKDKNGVEIYEGDKIDVCPNDGKREFIRTVTWDKDYAQFRALFDDGSGQLFTKRECRTFEVCDNIHTEADHD